LINYNNFFIKIQLEVANIWSNSCICQCWTVLTFFLWEPAGSGFLMMLWEPDWFSKYIYHSSSSPKWEEEQEEPINDTENSENRMWVLCENLGLVFSPILTFKSVNWFSLWEPVWEPGQHLRTAQHSCFALPPHSWFILWIQNIIIFQFVEI